MLNTELRKQEITKIKTELISRYIYLMCSIFLIYMLIFIFYMKDTVMIFYLAGGCAGLSTWLFIQKRLSVERIVHLYLIISPLFNFYIMLKFWNLSIASFVWLVPIPLGAYIFFSSKKVLIFSLYAIFTIIIVMVVANYFSFKFIQHPMEKIRITDTFLFISNVMVVTLLVHYKDKIRKLETLTEIEEKEQILMPITLDEKHSMIAGALFKRIEKIIEEKQLYKDNTFNISVLSTILSVNNNYISKAIRHHGFSNFNNYINSHRIKHVKQLMEETDLEKVTLMYIYTEAGFTSQTTFNSVFKQFEGVSPSEYIKIRYEKL